MWGVILTFLSGLLPVVVWKVFSLLSIGVVTYSGLDFALTELQNYVFTQMSGLPSNVLSIMVLAKLDIGIKIITASYVAAFTTKLLFTSSIGKV